MAEDRQPLWLLAGSGKAGASRCWVKPCEAQFPHRISRWGGSRDFGGHRGAVKRVPSRRTLHRALGVRVPCIPHRSRADSAFSGSREQGPSPSIPPSRTPKGRVVRSWGIGEEAHPGLELAGAGRGEQESRCPRPLPGAARGAGSGTGPERCPSPDGPAEPGPARPGPAGDNGSVLGRIRPLSRPSTDLLKRRRRKREGGKGGKKADFNHCHLV